MVSECCPFGVSVVLVAVDYQLSVVSALHFENEAQHQKAVPTAITTKPFLSRNGGSLAQGVDHEATENTYAHTHTRVHGGVGGVGGVCSLCVLCLFA